MTAGRTVLRGLLSKGYLPKELPLVFTSSDFGKHATNNIEQWRNDDFFATEPAAKIRTAAGRVPKRGSYRYEQPHLVYKIPTIAERKKLI